MIRFNSLARHLMVSPYDATKSLSPNIANTIVNWVIKKSSQIVFCDLGENIWSLCVRKACAGVLNGLWCRDACFVFMLSWDTCVREAFRCVWGRDVLRPWPGRPWLRLWHVVHATRIKGIYRCSAEPSWIGRGVWKAGTGNGGRLFVAREWVWWYGSISKLYFVIWVKIFGLCVQGKPALVFWMGSDVEMLALCSCLAGKRVWERRFGAFEVVMCCDHGRDALGCGCGMICMLQGSREYILARLSHRISVAASEKAGTGNGGRLFVAREWVWWYGSIAKLYFVIWMKIFGLCVQGKPALVFWMGSDVEMLALCSCLAGKRVWECLSVFS